MSNFSWVKIYKEIAEKIKNNHKNNVLVIYHRSINGKSS